jgi:hypothetical protein
MGKLWCKEAGYPVLACEKGVGRMKFIRPTPFVIYLEESEITDFVPVVALRSRLASQFF